MLGPLAAKKMLDEGWKPTAQEAKEIGMFIQDKQDVVQTKLLAAKPMLNKCTYALSVFPCPVVRLSQT